MDIAKNSNRFNLVDLDPICLIPIDFSPIGYVCAP